MIEMRLFREGSHDVSFEVLSYAGVPDQWFNFVNGAAILAVLIGQRIVSGTTED